jgi:predicted protein tyrosine phosphatase
MIQMLMHDVLAQRNVSRRPTHRETLRDFASKFAKSQPLFVSCCLNSVS